MKENKEYKTWRSFEISQEKRHRNTLREVKDSCKIFYVTVTEDDIARADHRGGGPHCACVEKQFRNDVKNIYISVPLQTEISNWAYGKYHSCKPGKFRIYIEEE